MRAAVSSGDPQFPPARFPARESGWISRTGATVVALALLSAVVGFAALRWGPALLQPATAGLPSAPIRSQPSRAGETLELTADEVALVEHLNEARTDPRGFAERHLRARAGRSAAARECYVEMKRTAARPRLEVSKTLVASARDHALDLGRSGGTGHVGSNGSTLEQRVARHGRWQRTLGENCAYGIADPLEIVLGLLIDEGIAGRGHRRNILDPSFRHVGVAIRPHAGYRTNAVIDFAGGVDG